MFAKVINRRQKSSHASKEHHNCKFGNFCDGFIFAKFRDPRNGEITLSFTDIGKSCSSQNFNVANMSFNVIREKIFSRKCTVFTVFIIFYLGDSS